MSAPAHVPLTERQAAILGALQSEGRVEIGRLAELSGGSRLDVAFDLGEIGRRGHLVLAHYGEMPLSYSLDTGEGL